MTDKQRDLYLQRRHGLTLRQYYIMLKIGHGRCWVCERPPKKGKNLAVEHDHKTGRVRALACYACNKFVIGRFRDPKRFINAAKILESDFDGRKL